MGLAHVDCDGRDQSTDSSIMSYSPHKNSSGLDLGPSPGDLHATELFVLSLNPKALPSFEYDAQVHNPEGYDLSVIEDCFFAPMSDYIGPFVHLPGTGYELYHDGARVSGAPASLFTLTQAKANCIWNLEANPTIDIDCRYNGQSLIGSL